MALTDPVFAYPVANAASTRRAVRSKCAARARLAAEAPRSHWSRTFGAGIGLSATSAQPYAGASAKAVAVISALYTAVALVASFGLGGYADRPDAVAVGLEDIAEGDFRDGAHGFAVGRGHRVRRHGRRFQRRRCSSSP